MSYIITKRKVVGGVPYNRGDEVDTSTLTLAKLATLVRVGLLIESGRAAEVAIEEPPAVTAPSVEEPVEATEEDPGGVCPDCGEGPFRNLRLHITRSHEDEMTEEE